jgi:hypothetical protein
VPEGVRLVLGRRLERLSEDARRILTPAAVIGRVFSFELLEDLEKARTDAALRPPFWIHQRKPNARTWSRWKR